MDKIPNETITRYSHLFRIIIDCKHPGPLHVRTLQRFETTDNNLESRRFIQETHPQVSTLCWKGRLQPLDLTEGGSPCTADSIQMKLSSVHNSITHLELDRWWIRELGPFIHFLHRYQFLSALSINIICNFHAVLPTTTVDIPPQELLLPTINTLCLDFTIQRNNGKHDMGLLEVLKYCPNLQKLETIGLWTHYSMSYKTAPFHHYCPKINSLLIKSAHWISDMLPIYVDDADLASLIELTTFPKMLPEPDLSFGEERIAEKPIETPVEGLRFLKVSISIFHQRFSDALVDAHANTLEVMELDLKSVYQTDKTDMFYAVQNILYYCQRLRKFSFKHMLSEDNTDDIAHILFIEPWGCSATLEELFIEKIGSQSGGARVLDNIVVDAGITWVWHASGKMRMAEEIEMQIVDQIKCMPRLKCLSLNQVKFLKALKN
ncbi:hypothetical protein BGZ46_004582 [Entomortierella lignicola]|nr:hypothetical protein BGZ46_004582 [Entomortierella lignicola]